MGDLDYYLLSRVSVFLKTFGIIIKLRFAYLQCSIEEPNERRD
jgi:hypothetical protein